MTLFELIQIIVVVRDDEVHVITCDASLMMLLP